MLQSRPGPTGGRLVKGYVIAASSIALAGILTAMLFSYLSGGTDMQQAIPQSEAVSLPVDLPLLFSETRRNYNTLDGSYTVVYENIIDSRRHCEFCTVIEFRDGPAFGTPDVSWVADRPFNIQGAQTVTFYAMGDSGGEEVRFKAAGKRADAVSDGRAVSILDFDIRTKPVTLTNEWQKFEVDLSSTNLSGVVGAFGMEPGEGQTVRVFVKGMTIESEPADEPLELEGDGP
jgi:hypothetical protein